MTITENIENIPDPLNQTAETGPEMSDTVDEVSGHSADLLLTDTEVDLIKKDLLHRQVHQEMLELREHLSIAPLFFDKSILQPPPKPVDTGFFNITALFRSNPPTPEPSATTPNSSNTSLHTDINIETPLLQYAFNNFVLNFPFLEKADQSIWHKIQEFLNSFSRLRFGAYAVSEEELSKRERIAIRVENLLTILFNTGITTHGKIEEKKSTNQQDVKMQPRKPHRIKNSQSNLVHVQILTVRKNVEQGYLREKEYSEFVIKSHFIESDETFHVRQRYSQIKKFYEKLGREFPDQDLSGPPRRFKTQPDAALYCEKDRLALQAYLRKLLRNQAVASSQLTRDFLTSTPTDLTPEDIQNADVRAKSVQARAEEHSKFLKVAEQQAEELREITDSFVQDISEPGGLNKLAKALEEVSEIEKLPVSYQKMIELARINLASTFYRIFCAEESAVIHFQQLRQAHSMLPYRALKGILMISNPTAMMKAVLDLFLAQPFGHPSILQRVVSSNLHDSLKKKKKVIEGLRAEIKDEPLCDRIHNYVYSSESRPYDGETGMSDLDKLFRVVRDNTIKPIDVNPLVLMKLWSAKEHLETSNRSKELLETTGSLEGFSDSEIMLKNLHKFMFLSTQVRNTELTMDLIFEGITGELLKDILSIFYQPLAQIYKDANISDFVIDCRDFIDKLIQVIEANDIDQGKNDTT
ncbi:hypothetical protein K7432_007396 [Basidiobolus ranarum]|uniref:PX domain-containing protein n=1 Tax=Basidiobolus ranarum TaxID=34480 RepID=A0ABR2W042_9FUNG